MTSGDSAGARPKGTYQRAWEIAARIAAVMLALYLTVPLVASEEAFAGFDGSTSATIAGAVLVAAIGVVALARAPQPQSCRGGGAARGACRRACRPQLGASRGGRRQSRQEPLPRDGQPRDPHAAQRHSRHDRAPARYAAAARTGHLREGGADVRRDAALADRGDPRFLQSRGRQARSRATTVRLVALVEETVELLGPRAQAKGLEIASSIDDRLPAW